jgi:hypothetical protein
LQTIDGVGPITALTWALETGTPERFASIKHAQILAGSPVRCGNRLDTRQHRGIIDCMQTPGPCSANMLVFDRAGRAIKQLTGPELEFDRLSAPRTRQPLARIPK